MLVAATGGRRRHMIREEVIRELPLLNLGQWARVPKPLAFSCDIQSEQDADSPNPLMSVSKVVVQGVVPMHAVKAYLMERIGLVIDFYLNGASGSVSSEPAEGEVTSCRDAINAYFDALERCHARGGDPQIAKVAFGDIPVRQPATLSWKSAFTADGRFCPHAVAMSYNLNDAFLLVESAVRETVADVDDDVAAERRFLEDVVSDTVTVLGLTAENLSVAFDGTGSAPRWDSGMLAGKWRGDDIRAAGDDREGDEQSDDE